MEPDLGRSLGCQRSVAIIDDNDNLSKLHLKMPTSPRNKLLPSYPSPQDSSPTKQAVQPSTQNVSHSQTLPSYGAKSTYQSSPNYQPPGPNYSFHETPSDQPQQASVVPDKADVVYRDKGRTESKSGSKRNSLDNKTVQVIDFVVNLCRVDSRH